MRTSESVVKIAAALVSAHKNIKNAVKDAKNPHFRNDYASLESVIEVTKQAYLDAGVVVLQGMNADGSALTTRLQHSSGEFYETDTKLVLSKNDMQGLGSAITYARRYALAAISNLTQADDDGNEASGNVAKTLPPKPKGKASSSNDEF